MDIFHINFEEEVVIQIKDEVVKFKAFKTLEHGNIKFGLTAPRTINVHREEIFHAIREKETEQKVAEELS